MPNREQKLEAIIQRKNTLYDKIRFNARGQRSEPREGRSGMIKVDAEWQMSQPPIQNKGKLQHVAVFNQTQRSPSPSPRTLAPGTRRHTLARPLGPGGAASLAPNSGSGVKTNLAPLHLAGWPHDLQSRGVGLSQRPEDPKSDLGGTGKDRTGRRPSQGASR